MTTNHIPEMHKDGRVFECIARAAIARAKGE